MLEVRQLVSHLYELTIANERPDPGITILQITSIRSGPPPQRRSAMRILR